MKYLNNYNESLFTKSRIDKDWLNSLVKELNEIGKASLIDYGHWSLCIDFNYKEVNFKILINEEVKLMKSNINIVFISNVEDIIDRISRSIDYSSYTDDDYYDDFDEYKYQYRYPRRFMSTIEEDQFYKKDNLTNKNYKTEISYEIILSKIEPIINKLEKSKRSLDEHQSRREQDRRRRIQRDKEIKERNKRIKDEFVKNLPQEDLLELMVELSDIIGNSPIISLDNDSYKVNYKLNKLNIEKKFSKEDIWYKPSNEYLQLLSTINDIDNKLKNIYNCELYYSFEESTNHGKLKLRIKKNK